jgi:hypothetical protein
VAEVVVLVEDIELVGATTEVLVCTALEVEAADEVLAELAGYAVTLAEEAEVLDGFSEVVVLVVLAAAFVVVVVVLVVVVALAVELATVTYMTRRIREAIYFHIPEIIP